MLQIGSPLDKVNVGLFRLKALAGGAYDSLSRSETTTLQRLRVWDALCCYGPLRCREMLTNFINHVCGLLLVQDSIEHVIEGALTTSRLR